MKTLFLHILLLTGSMIPHVPIEAEEFPSMSTKSKSSSENKSGVVVLFTPPSGWHYADPTLLPPSVKTMVVGQGSSNFPPSINLSMEPYKGTLKQYLKTIKNMNEAQGYEWKDLGLLRTEAGNANLSQVDSKSQWGDIRHMHVIIIRNGNVYLLSASALKNEFSIYYKDFFNAMRSLRVSKDIVDLVTNPQQRSIIKSAIQKVENSWNPILAESIKNNPDKSLNDQMLLTFNDTQFQTEGWKPFKEVLEMKFSDLGPEWQSLMLQKVENDLFKSKIH